MKRFCLYTFLILSLSGTNLAGQTPANPQRLDDLLTRAAEFRRLLAAGDRVKASELVISAKRKAFLNKPPTSLDNLRIVGIDFIDKDHVAVRVTGQSLVSGGSGAQLTQPQVADVWVRQKGNWFFQPDTGDLLTFSGMFKADAAADAAALTEIKSSFKLVTESLDAGQMWQGDHKDMPVKFEYSGTSAIRIVSKIDSPVSMIDVGSTQWITKDSKDFKITVGSDDFDGPFEVPVTFTVYYKSVAFDETVRLKGSIRPVFKFRQEPAAVPVESKEEFRVVLTNNTDEAAEFGSFDTEGKFYVTSYPRHLGPGEEAVITLKRNPVPGTPPGRKVSITVENHLKGKLVCEIPVH